MVSHRRLGLFFSIRPPVYRYNSRAVDWMAKTLGYPVLALCRLQAQASFSFRRLQSDKEAQVQSPAELDSRKRSQQQSEKMEEGRIEDRNETLAARNWTAGNREPVLGVVLWQVDEHSGRQRHTLKHRVVYSAVSYLPPAFRLTRRLRRRRRR